MGKGINAQCSTRGEGDAAQFPAVQPVVQALFARVDDHVAATAVQVRPHGSPTRRARQGNPDGSRISKALKWGAAGSAVPQCRHVKVICALSYWRGAPQLLHRCIPVLSAPPWASIIVPWA